MFEHVEVRAPRNTAGDWLVRAGIAVAFVLFGLEKFPSNPESQWARLFQQIGAGQWFRYFTGAMEILGGVLVLIPWTVTAGLALLACTMAGAVLIWIFVIGQPANSFIAGGFLIGLVFFWLNRRG